MQARERPPQRSRGIPLVLQAVMAAALACTSGCLDAIVLSPTYAPALAQGNELRLVRMDRGSAEVCIARSRGAARREPEAYVLAFSGMRGRAEKDAPAVADLWGNRPVEVWAVNYPGQGESSGPSRVRKIPDQALTVYDALQAQAQGRSIFVVGQSFGTTVALHVAAERPVAGVYVREPLPLRQLLIRRCWGLPFLASQVPGDLDVLANGRLAQAPAIFLVSEKDGVIPIDLQYDAVLGYAGRKRLIVLPADHSEPIRGHSVAEVQVALDWLWSERSQHLPSAEGLLAHP